LANDELRGPTGKALSGSKKNVAGLEEKVVMAKGERRGLELGWHSFEESVEKKAPG